MGLISSTVKTKLYLKFLKTAAFLPLPSNFIYNTRDDTLHTQVTFTQEVKWAVQLGGRVPAWHARRTHCPGFDPRHCSTWVDKKWDGLQSVFLLQFQANRSSSSVVTLRWKVAYPLGKGGSKGSVKCPLLLRRLPSCVAARKAKCCCRSLQNSVSSYYDPASPRYWARISLIYLISFCTMPGQLSLNCFSMLDWLFPNCAP